MTVLVRGEVFAHAARSVLFDGRSLTLVDLAPSTFWLTATPVATLTYLPTGAFLDLCAERGGAGGEHRVRGTLSLLNPDAQLVGQAVLSLRNPHVTASGLAYDADVLEGLVPAESGACVLFLQWDAAPGQGASPAVAPPDPQEGATA